MRRIQAVIFDLDGLIVDSEPLHLRAMNQALAPVGITLTEADWVPRVGYKSIETIRLLHAQHHFDRDPEEIERDKVRAYHHLIREAGALKLMPGVHEAIRACQQARLALALASSAVRADITIILSAFALDALFEVVIAGDEVPQGKPDPAIFLKAAEGLAVDPAACLVLEDSATGIVAAKAAGMVSVAIPSRFTRQQHFDGAQVILDTLFDFAEMLDNLLKEIQTHDGSG
jgi:HAD superfamily hydrolase (TIGR01509 family)